MFDYLIVGAGFAGAVLAERLAAGSGKRVLICDRRPHIGGNAYDCHDDAGLLVHRYGPHVFHTNSRAVFEYLSRFTAWRPYEHRVLASVDGQLVPIPINLDTVNRLYGLSLTSVELEAFFQEVAEKVERVKTSEDAVVSKVGRELYEKLFRGYTRKQWGLDPRELDASVAARVPARTNRDDRYFTDTHQAMPLHGYTRMFERMLAHENIEVMLNTDYREIERVIPYREMIYTGPIDAFFGYRFGKLPYRSLELRHETLAEARAQPVGTVNYPNEHAYTRITEFKHLTGQEHPKTSIVYEYPRAEGDPYYPVPRPENAALYARYRELARATPRVRFVGRLATYRYYNMDQVVAQALTLYNDLLAEHAPGRSIEHALRRTAARDVGRPEIETALDAAPAPGLRGAMTLVNHRITLAARPVGMPKPTDYTYGEEPVRDPADGEVLVKTRYISLDPAMRGWMNEGKSYIPPIQIGEVFRALALGDVVASKDPAFAPGDHVSGMLGVQEYATLPAKGLTKVPPIAPLPVFLSALGMPGLTAYFGLLDVGRPQPGETVVVSAAAGAVGQIVGQIAKIKGCRAVGIAGGPEKCAYVRELGFDAAIDYKGSDVAAGLREHCPDGIHVYFDNVGGDILDAALARLAMRARVVLCGGISQYNATGKVTGPSNYLSLLVNRASMIGMIVFDYAARYPEAIAEMAGWMAAGKLRSREDIVRGLETFPAALNKLFTGENLGKLILEV